MNTNRTFKLIIGTNACCSRLSSLRVNSATFVQGYNKEHDDIRLELQIVNIGNIAQVIPDSIKDTIDYRTGIRRRYDYKTRQYVEENAVQSFRDFIYLDGHGVRLSPIFNKQTALELIEEATANDSTTTK